MTDRPRSRAGLVALGVVAACLVLILAGLGVWQVQRLHWKTDLIARTEARLAGPVQNAPAPEDWAKLAADDEYRRITLTGQYRFQDEALAQAVTQFGAGFWVMTPLETPQGWMVWVNRGFVPQDARDPADRSQPQGDQQVTGLMRMSQPDGAFLRSNDPANDRWYSRDTAALAQSRGLDRAAPYFIDRADDQSADLPRGGLTVVQFRNSHLSYALTWFTMALGLALASGYLLRREWQKNPSRSDP
ncbi:SURF1 family protein [Paracoccus homiensis]|uniref:SURF1-like protein n=1 Tax=Paracoccus homiensis TaxID=364199 RepID=A0A1I0H8T1_9RHOB|nr:SURF1 family protein [Paracoccus homiensis]SET79312.1 surfeit locus 1 family protein [Paracoccus homiensis]